MNCFSVSENQKVSHKMKLKSILISCELNNCCAFNKYQFGI